MFAKRASTPSETDLTRERFATLIGEQTAIHGDLELADGIRIDGELRGNLTRRRESHVAVVIGPAGRVTGNLDASRVLIAGSVHGSILAEADVELQASAVVQGDVQCKSLRVAHGAKLTGRILTSDAPMAAPKPVLVIDQGEAAEAPRKLA